MRSLFLALVALVAAAACDDGSPDRAVYDVVVVYDDGYTPELGGEILRALRAFDNDAEIVSTHDPQMQLRATVRTAREDLCEDLLRRLAGREGVSNLNCQPAAGD